MYDDHEQMHLDCKVGEQKDVSCVAKINVRVQTRQNLCSLL